MYNLNQTRSESFDDGTYRPSEYKNDEAFYQFGYKVNAIETGDIKQHTETRVNDEVKGAYFLIEPNGVSRLVQYIANSRGFNAVVRHQYGTRNSKNLNTNNSTQSDPFRFQGFHTNIVNESKVNIEEKLPQRQTVAFDSFLQEHDDKYGQQNVAYRQSSPKSISNQSSIRLPSNFSEKFGNLSESAAQIPLKPSVVGERRQYEVIDPEVDIDIRRSISKPFLNLEKLKQPRKEDNK